MEGGSGVGHPPEAVLDVIARLGTQGEPGAGLEGEVRIKVGESALLGIGLQTPVGVEAPVDEIHDLALAFGLESVVQPQAHDVLAVNGVNRVVVREINRQQAQAGQLVIELGQGIGAGVVGPGHKHVIERRLKDMAQAVQLEEVVFGARPEARGFEGDVRAGVEDPARQLIGGGAGTSRWL